MVLPVQITYRQISTRPFIGLTFNPAALAML
jgi:hypothetical protein